MKKIRLLSMQKFTSATVYFSILSTGLSILLQVYTRSVLSGDDRFTNPLIFAIAVLALGFLTSLIYWLFNLLLKVIMSVIMRKETNGLNALSTEETTLIGFITSIFFGVICFDTSKDIQGLEFMHQMLFSLPIAKLAFITTSAVEVWKDVSGLINKSIRVWPFVLYITVEFVIAFFLEKYSIIINIALMLVVVFLFLCNETKRMSAKRRKTGRQTIADGR